MKVLITGITGFAGSHLADYALARGGVQVFGTARWRSPSQNIEQIVDKITVIDADLRDASSVDSLVVDIKPDWIFHLAAQSYVVSSWKVPSETITTNIVGTVNVFEAVRRAKYSPRMLVACSSEEYGFVKPEEIPITEENALRPLSPYGVSKVGQDLLSYQYFKSYGTDVVRTRAFNHTGPRRGRVFVCSDFAIQIVEAQNGLRPYVSVGNVDAVRDFADVRDVVRAYWLALEKGEAGEVYNICTGKGYSIREVLAKLMAVSGADVEVRQDPKRLRPSDVPLLIGDNAKFSGRTGWHPEIPFEQTLSDIFDYWRQRI
ncbi:MAG: NAD-dependent epimerase/dehydratase family protein [candidate division Zixibacteria bacterium]|nr:NAD-dependent epimerase/dehydratase family protein [candidate division Zixibacteria bacterium]